MKDDMPVTDRVINFSEAGVTVEDAELVKRFKSGDESAFTLIVKRYQPKLQRVAAILLKNEQDAMDIVQDVFVKAYFKLNLFREDASLYTWLYRILYNGCISFLRRKKIVTFLSFDNDENNEFSFPSNEPVPDEVFERSEIMNAVSGAMSKLPLRQRTAFALKQLNGLKFSEISGIMGITEGAAKASYFHAVKKLQSMLKSYGEDYGMR